MYYTAEKNVFKGLVVWLIYRCKKAVGAVNGWRGWPTFVFNSLFLKLGCCFSTGLFGTSPFSEITSDSCTYTIISVSTRTRKAGEDIGGGGGIEKWWTMEEAEDLWPTCLFNGLFFLRRTKMRELYRIFRLIPLTTLWLPCDGCKMWQNLSYAVGPKDDKQ